MTQPRPADPPTPCASTIGDRPALVAIDVQVGFDDPSWGPRNNPGADANIDRLVREFTQHGHPVVYVRHNSIDPASPLHPRHAGNALKPYLRWREPDLWVTKTVNSAFHGTPDLHAWLVARQVSDLFIAGITTNHCCETTARLAGNLGHRVHFVLDATHTFDRTGPDGTVVTADDLARITAANLHGEFATVSTTRDVLTAMALRRRASSH
jgi:nicotinamidase-related amidase